MGITERQTEILDKLIQEYIDSARPVSSQLLEKKYDLSICPAMIRIEMQKLRKKIFGTKCDLKTSKESPKGRPAL